MGRHRITTEEFDELGNLLKRIVEEFDDVPAPITPKPFEPYPWQQIPQPWTSPNTPPTYPPVYVGDTPYITHINLISKSEGG